MVCTECGYTEPNFSDFVLDNVSKQREDADERQVFNNGFEKVAKGRYTQESHLNEVLAQKAGAGGTVKRQVVEHVARMYRVWRIPLEQANDKTTLVFMRALGYRNIYEHCTQITHFISKRAPKWNPTPQQQQVLVALFNGAKIAWKNAPSYLTRGRGGKKKGIPSFPNYQDFLKRCCIMKGYDELAKELKELKTPRKIREMNNIWRHFGKFSRWEDYEVAYRPEYA
jgi:Poxvirus Late Transcription Factor VLTF3 like